MPVSVTQNEYNYGATERKSTMMAFIKAIKRQNASKDSNCDTMQGQKLQPQSKCKKINNTKQRQSTYQTKT